MHKGNAMPRHSAALRVLLVAAIVTAGFAPIARAQDDLPGRVGRIADVGGQLYLSPDDRPSEWQPVGVNYPVTSGDNLWVGGGDGRAEVDYGGGQFRLAGDTNLHVSRLDENKIALFIAQGRVVVRLRVLDPGDSAYIDAPNTQIQLTRVGLYRIDVLPDQQSTSVTVREGEAVVMLANGAQQALPGQTAIVTGADATAANVVNGTGQDGFDAWSASRDHRYDRPRGNEYVSRQMVGAADLDQYGTWQSTPEYGPVWYPTSVPTGWAPYQNGYWANVGGWGMTWVDSAPWGYAPFHYGRWAYVGGRWGWCPGAYVARPVWAPALVGWVGGPGWAVSANFGSPVYGWVPLGWGEPLHPWWRRCSYNCWASYNRPYAVNVTVRPTAPPTQFRNVVVPGAVSAVAGTTLNGRLMVRDHLVPVASQQMRAAPVLAAAPPVPASSPHLGPRPGTAGTPQPASTYYPVSRQGRLGVEAGARQPAAPPAVAAPVPGRTMTRPTTTPAPAPGADPTGTARGRIPAPGSTYPAATTNAPQPPPTTTRTRTPQPAASPEMVTPGSPSPSPTARGEAARQRPPAATVPPGVRRHKPCHAKPAHASARRCRPPAQRQRWSRQARTARRRHRPHKAARQYSARVAPSISLRAQPKKANARAARAKAVRRSSKAVTARAAATVGVSSRPARDDGRRRAT